MNRRAAGFSRLPPEEGAIDVESCHEGSNNRPGGQTFLSANSRWQSPEGLHKSAKADWGQQMFLLESHQLKLGGTQEEARPLDSRPLEIGKLFNPHC